MNEKTTYRAIFYGANPIAAGTERDLAFVDGGYQQTVTLQVEEDGATVRRVMAAQTVPPVARPDSPADGAAAVAAYGNYQRSFVTPVPQSDSAAFGGK